MASRTLGEPHRTYCVLRGTLCTGNNCTLVFATTCHNPPDGRLASTREVNMLQMSLVDDTNCQGVIFNVTDTDALARAIALILIQEFSLAKQLTGDPDAAIPVINLDRSDIDDIILRRLKPVDTYHRDGLLFQLVMWLAAHLDLQAGDLVALPHAQGSAKGQDSLIVHRASDSIVALSICEDKATENPRVTVRSEVWPEIQTYESGGRRDELRSGVIATLGTGGVGTKEAEKLIRGISWEGKRRYRVRVTLENDRSKKLFDGFPDLVGGGSEMRRGETILVPAMRKWMNDLALRIESQLRTLVKAP